MDLYYCAPLLTFLVGHKRSLKRQRICDPSLGIRCKFLEAAQATPSPPEFMPLCALASSTILGEELSATFSNFMWGRIGGTRRCNLHLGETSTWHVGQLGAHCSGQLQIYWILAKFAKFTPEFMPLCALWLAQGGGASASTRGKCIKGDVSLVCIFIGQQLSRQWVLVKFCISLLCILTISPAGGLETLERTEGELGDSSQLASKETSLYKRGAAAKLGLHLF